MFMTLMMIMIMMMMRQLVLKVNAAASAAAAAAAAAAAGSQHAKNESAFSKWQQIFGQSFFWNQCCEETAAAKIPRTTTGGQRGGLDQPTLSESDCCWMFI